MLTQILLSFFPTFPFCYCCFLCSGRSDELMNWFLSFSFLVFCAALLLGLPNPVGLFPNEFIFMVMDSPCSCSCSSSIRATLPMMLSCPVPFRLSTAVPDGMIINLVLAWSALLCCVEFHLELAFRSKQSCHVSPIQSDLL